MIYRPCADLCYQAYTSCWPQMQRYGIMWPVEWSCDVLPTNQVESCFEPEENILPEPPPIGKYLDFKIYITMPVFHLDEFGLRHCILNSNFGRILEMRNVKSYLYSYRSLWGNRSACVYISPALQQDIFPESPWPYKPIWGKQVGCPLPYQFFQWPRLGCKKICQGVQWSDTLDVKEQNDEPVSGKSPFSCFCNFQLPLQRVLWSGGFIFGNTPKSAYGHIYEE